MIDQSAMLAVLAIGIILGLVFLGVIFKKKGSNALNSEYFQMRWKDLQKMCSDKKTWPLAVIDADKLLDEALIKSKYKGKTMGERMVSAQRQLSNNDSAWFAHKLRNKLVHEQYTQLKESDVKDALVGFRQALKDLGAMK